MEIHLPQEVEDIINRHIKSGIYHSPTEVIVQALWLLDGWNDTEEERLEKLRKVVQEGIDSGPSISGAEFFAQLREELEAKMAKSE